MPGRKPNILFLQTDQQRMDALGCYGNPIVQTPNMDRLAEQGVRFANAFTCCAVCTPARGALLSGRYPHRTGMVCNPELPSGISSRLCEYTVPVRPFSEGLHRAGYACHHVGKWHIGSWFDSKPSDYGFTGVFYPGYGYPREHKHYLRYLRTFGVGGFELKAPPEGTAARRYFNLHDVPVEASIPGYLASQTMDALRKLGKGGQPFFLACDFWGPHIPVNIPAEYLDMYKPDDMLLPPSFRNIADNRPEIVLKAHKLWGGEALSEDMVRAIVARYYGYVTLIDHQIGCVLECADSLGLLDNTVVIFTADHGSTLGTHGLQDKGLNMYDDVYRIPMIVSGPVVRKKGVVVDEIVSHIDLAPTFLSIAGARAPRSYDGRTLMPYLRGRLDHVIRDEMVMQGFGHQVPFPQRAVRDRRFKYIFNATAKDEFYDIVRDPHETANLIDIVDPDLLGRYQRRLQVWMEENDDPLRRYYAGTTFTRPYTVSS